MSALRKIGNILLILLGIILIAAGWLMYKIENPEFQTDISQRAVRYLSRRLNTDISVGHVELKFFHSILLNDVLMKDHNHDTLLAARTIEAQFNVINVFRNKYIIDHVTLDDATVYLHRPLQDTDWNFQFLLDALKSKSNSNQPSKLELALGKVELNQTHFVLLDEPNIIRLNFFLPSTIINVNMLDLNQPKFDLSRLVLDHADLHITKLVRTEPDTATFPQPDTAIVHINTKSIQLFVSDLQFVDSKFTYDDLNEKPTPGNFDGFHQQYDHLNLHFSKSSLVADTVKAHIENISMQEKSGFVANHMEADVTLTPKEAKADHLKLVTPQFFDG